MQSARLRHDELAGQWTYIQEIADVLLETKTELAEALYMARCGQQP